MQDQTTNNLIIGETCLLNVQLRRLGLTSGPHNIFDNALVNLDGVRSIIENDFNDLITSCEFKDYTFYPEHNITHHKFISNKYSADTSNIFSWNVMCHFHTDRLSPDIVSSLERKIQRTKKVFESDAQTNLFYYYRFNKNYDIKKIKEKVKSFLTLIEIKYSKKFKFFLFTNNLSEAKAYHHSVDNNIVHFHIESPSTWVGIDENWDAKTDNDTFDSLKYLMV